MDLDQALARLDRLAGEPPTALDIDDALQALDDGFGGAVLVSIPASPQRATSLRRGSDPELLSPGSRSCASCEQLRRRLRELAGVVESKREELVLCQDELRAKTELCFSMQERLRECEEKHAERPGSPPAESPSKSARAAGLQSLLQFRTRELEALKASMKAQGDALRERERREGEMAGELAACRAELQRMTQLAEHAHAEAEAHQLALHEAERAARREAELLRSKLAAIEGQPRSPTEGINGSPKASSEPASPAAGSSGAGSARTAAAPPTASPSRPPPPGAPAPAPAPPPGAKAAAPRSRPPRSPPDFLKAPERPPPVLEGAPGPGKTPFDSEDDSEELEHGPPRAAAGGRRAAGP
eukprot:tig00000241_g20983.t1